MKHTTKKMAVLAFVLMLSCLLFSACGGQQQASSDSVASGQSGASAAAVDVSSFKTLGDVLAVATSNPGAVYDDTTYIAVFEAGDSIIRVVAKLEPGMSDKIFDLDSSSDDYFKQFADFAGNLELVSAEDITAGKLSQDVLDEYVGKTGQDMLDDGFTFSNYYAYGGDDTGALMEKGDFGYGVTFDVKITEAETDDEGASIKGATVKEIEYQCLSEAALDLSSVE